MNPPTIWTLRTLEVLEEQLREFTGALIMVTHDRWFLDRVAEEIYAYEPDGSIRHYPGNYSYYLRRKSEQRQQESAAREQQKIVERETAPAAPKPAGLHYMEKKELETIEARILEEEAEVETCRAAMQDEKISSDSHALGQAFQKMNDAEKKVEELYARWDELERKRAGE